MRSLGPCVPPLVELRHDSKYAALVSCGVYKAKKNKALVAIARDEWKLTAAAPSNKAKERTLPTSTWRVDRGVSADGGARVKKGRFGGCSSTL